MLRYPEEAVEPIWPSIQMARGCCKITAMCLRLGFLHCCFWCLWKFTNLRLKSRTTIHLLAVFLRGWCYLTSLLLTWAIGQSEFLAHLQMIANWREEVLWWRAELPPRKTLAFWRTRLTWTSWSLFKVNAKSWVWAGIIPCSNTGY